MRISPALLSRILLSLTNLSLLTLVGNPIVYGGFRLVVSSLRQLRGVESLHFCDNGLTWQSLAEAEKVLLSCPRLGACRLFCEKKSFPPPGEDITKVSSLTTLRLSQDRALKEPALSYGYKITHGLVFHNLNGQAIVLKFYD